MTIILHLYSGRRRANDFQAWCEHFLATRGFYHICVISLDTAVSKTMDVYDNATWSFLYSAAVNGSIRALLCGPPCETWSAVRSKLLPSPDGRTGPRPLRSRNQPWGLPQRGWAEMEQVRIGSTLLLRAVWLMVHVSLTGGRAVLEHPATSPDDTAPSIWLTSLITLIVQKEQICRLCTIEQWLWDSPGIKPTGLMYSNVDLPAVLASHRQDHLPRPMTSLVGQH